MSDRPYGIADEDRFRDASDDTRAPFRAAPNRYDEPYDMGCYAGPHGYRYYSPTLAVCLCGWHPMNHPGFQVTDHLRDMGVRAAMGHAALAGEDDPTYGGRIKASES